MRLPHLPPTAKTCSLCLHQLRTGTLGDRDGAEWWNRRPLFDQSCKLLEMILWRPAADAAIITQLLPKGSWVGRIRLRVQDVELHQLQKTTQLDQVKAHLSHVLFRVGTRGLPRACYPLETFLPTTPLFPCLWYLGQVTLLSLLDQQPLFSPTLLKSFEAITSSCNEFMC